jgi:FkbM family methyltransferase
VNGIAALKKVLVETVRANPWGEMALDWIPQRSTLWDGRERIVPRRLKAEIRLWRTSGAGEAEAVYASYEGGDMLDIGSFHGLYPAILAPKARRGSKFLCFEPDLRALPRLNHNLGIVSALFPDLAFSTLACVAGDGGTVETDFPMGEGHPRFSSAEIGGRGPKSVRVDDCVRLLVMRPSFVKIDVEGAELSVLKGLEATLSEHHPAIMLELHPKWQPPGSSVDAVLGLLHSHGYSHTDLSVDQTSIRQLWRPQK